MEEKYLKVFSSFSIKDEKTSFGKPDLRLRYHQVGLRYQFYMRPSLSDNLFEDHSPNILIRQHYPTINQVYPSITISGLNNKQFVKLIKTIGKLPNTTIE